MPALCSPPRQPWHHRWTYPDDGKVGRCSVCHAVDYSSWPYAFDCPGDGTWRKPIRVEWHGIVNYLFARPLRNIRQLAKDWRIYGSPTSKRGFSAAERRTRRVGANGRKIRP